MNIDENRSSPVDILKIRIEKFDHLLVFDGNNGPQQRYRKLVKALSSDSAYPGPVIRENLAGFWGGFDNDQFFSLFAHQLSAEAQ